MKNNNMNNAGTIGNNSPANPHDAAFKKLFSKKEIAGDIIEKNLPLEILKELDINALEKTDNSFVDEKLKETFSDIIYKVKLKGRESYIALLLEHKSYQDKLAIFQVARYIINMWSKIMESGKKELPVVIPIVVYHGKGSWNYKTDIRELIPNYHNLPKYLKERLPVLKHNLISFTDQAEKEIKTYHPLARLVVRSFKYIFDDQDKLAETLLISVEEIPAEITDEELYSILDILFLYYSATNKNLTEETIQEKIRELEGKGERLMTLLQEIEQRGLEKGIERGLEQGLEKGREEGRYEGLLLTAKNLIQLGMPLEQISLATGLEKEELNTLAKEIEN